MLGCHVHKENEFISNDIQSAIYDCNVYSLEMTTAAIFVSNPRKLQISLKDENKEKLKEFIKNKKIKIIAHSSYIASLWGKNAAVSLKFVLKEYKICKETGISGLVIHLPKEEILKKEKHIIQKLIHEVNMEENNPIIYLETPAILPMWANYDSGPKLSKLFSTIKKLCKGPHPFGLCIDTAHIWTSGHDISTYDGAKRWFSELMDMPHIPYDRLIIHLNDSARDLGHGPDKHASLTHGKIWNSYKTRAELKKSGLFFILEFSKEHNIPIILERNNKKMLKDDYTILQKIM